MKGLCGILVIAAGWFLTCEVERAVAQTPVELELALAVDVSSSVTWAEYRLQMVGLAAAFRHPDVIAAITSLGPPGIAVALAHWSGLGNQKVVVDWALVSDASSAAAFSRRIGAAERSFIGETSVGPALQFSEIQIEVNAFAGRRRTIDISADGGARYGERARLHRDRINEKGITINALAILTDDSDLDVYYRENVIGGPGAFVMTASDYEDFARAIVSKLIREIVPPISFQDAGGTQFAARARPD